jgi:DNA-binding response OmpR family regulator
MNMRILVVEDEPHIAEGLRYNLDAEGFEARVVNDGESALEALSSESYDALVLDVMLSGIDGFEVARRLRLKGDFTPILMLTARGRPEDVLKGFEAGTDDYLAKPFDLNIFFARLRGLLRRHRWAAHTDETKNGGVFEVNGRTIDLANLELRHQGDIRHLTVMEAKLLGYLITHAGTAVSRKTILEEVWGLLEDTDTRAIDNFIVRLRKYLEDSPNSPKILLTVRGVGYKFAAGQARSA